MFRSATSTNRSLRRALSMAAVIAVAAAGCSTDGGSGAAQTTTTAAPTTTVAPTTTIDSADDEPSDATGTEWCPSADEVAEVVGHDVKQAMAGGGSGTLDLSYSYDGCSYDGEDNTYGITRVTIEGGDDGSAFDLLAEAAEAESQESGFNAVEGLGDDAYLDGQILVYRSGKTMVFVEVDHPDDEDTADQRDALAADVADMDLSDSEVLCTAPAAPVEDIFGPVSDTRSGGGGLAIDDVDIEWDTCTFELDDGMKVKISMADDELWDDWVEAKKSSTFTASYEASSIGEYATFDNGEELLVDESSQPLRITAEGLEMSSEDAMALRADLAELVLAG
ncbi:MAG: hypothetical protein ABI239_14040 [Aquihabitans sp.]